MRARRPGRIRDIGIIIGLGFLLAQLRILDATAQGVLTRIAFYVASPALLVTVLGATDVRRLLSGNLIASLGSVAVAATSAEYWPECSGGEKLAKRSSPASVRPTSTLAISGCRSLRTPWAMRR